MMTREQFNKLMSIRKVELELTKSMSGMCGKEYKITINPLTRLLLKEKTKLMKELDEILEKI